MSGVSLVTGGMISPTVYPTASQIATAVWEKDLTTVTTPNSAGWFAKLIKSCGW